VNLQFPAVRLGQFPKRLTVSGPRLRNEVGGLSDGYGAALAAKEALTRDLSLEFAPQGIRVSSLRPHGIPETRTMTEVFEINAKATGMKWDQFTGYLAGTTH
jgi:NAD(P)-dependent dehydrogenase (short-subunit alcohol dehydrogenase family)